MMTYYTLATVGYWCSLDACCETKRDDIEGHTLLDHQVKFVLLNRFGERLDMGRRIITQPIPEEPAVFDEDGDGFPTLEAAIRHHADNILRITPQPGRPMAKPMRHGTSQGTEATAFDCVDA